MLAIARLTWLEVRRRRIVLAALVCGMLFLLVFAVAVHVGAAGIRDNVSLGSAVQRQVIYQTLTLVALYAVNFLVIALAVMLPVDTLSGEIDSGVMQTLAVKPVRRAQIVLGKYLVFWLMLAGYILVMSFGVVGIMRVITGFKQQNLWPALGLMQLEATVLLSIVFAGGARFSTVTNGIVAFAFYALAFIGGWIEQVGVLLGNPSARYIGTAISLVSPMDALWRKALYELQPPFMSQLQFSMFGSGTVISAAMVWWAVLFAIGVLALGVRRFQKRQL